MKRIQLKLVFWLVIFVLSCTNRQSKESFQRLEIWENIQQAVKEKRIDYLLKISKDTLDCVECNNGKSSIAKYAFYANHLDQIEQPYHKEYSIFSEEYNENGFNKRYRINYAEEYGGHQYNMIYTILAGKNSIQFQGVFSVP